MNLQHPLLLGLFGRDLLPFGLGTLRVGSGPSEAVKCLHEPNVALVLPYDQILYLLGHPSWLGVVAV